MGVGMFPRTNWKDIGVRSGEWWPWTVPGFLVACSVEKIEFELFSSVHLHVWSNFSEADAGAWVKQRSSTVSTPSIWLLLFSRSVVSDSLRPHGLQHARLPRPFLSTGVCSNSCPLNQWCHPTISSSVVPFSSATGTCSVLFFGVFFSGDI